MRVKPKSNFDPAGLILAVRKCRGDVTFRSNEGDVLNLKSGLSQFVFVAIAGKKELMEKAVLDLENPEDLAILGDFVEAVA